MKILYDHQIFTSHVYGGISRYFFELMRHFSQVGEPGFELSLRYSNNHYLNKTSLVNYRTFFKNYNFRGRYLIMSIPNKARSKKALSQQNFYIFHPTYYHPYFLKYIGKRPFALTIYDMIHEIFRQGFSVKDKTTEYKKVLVQKADKIIAISKNTKKDIIKFYDIEESKIAVTYLANSLSKPHGQSAGFTIPERYVLFVGSREGYKNFELFIKSISPLMAEDKDLNVVCAGGKPFSVFEKEIFKNLRLEKRIHCFAVTDEAMAWLYQNARAFVFPSLYEGFGIPVLEAFACGCPALLSNTSSLPEVGGDATVYFDPRSEISIKEAISKVIHSEELRCSLRAKGFKQLERFSWKKTAEETTLVYRSLL